MWPLQDDSSALNKLMHVASRYSLTMAASHDICKALGLRVAAFFPRYQEILESNSQMMGRKLARVQSPRGLNYQIVSLLDIRGPVTIHISIDLYLLYQEVLKITGCS
jgi:hypothetical protein